MTKQVELPFSPYLLVDWTTGEKGTTMYTADQMRQFREEGLNKLHPMHWTKEMSDAWHKALPDVTKAFEDLIAQSQAKD